MNNEQVLEKLSNDFPGHTFEFREYELYTDDKKLGYQYMRVEDIPLYNQDFSNIAKIMDAFYFEIHRCVESELEKRGV